MFHVKHGPYFPLKVLFMSFINVVDSLFHRYPTKKTCRFVDICLDSANAGVLNSSSRSFHYYSNNFMFLEVFYLEKLKTPNLDDGGRLLAIHF
jgi:hypothetical protein